MIKNLKTFLPLDQWGVGEAKTFEDLQTEIENRECQIIFDGLNPIRVVMVARIFVDYKGQQLVETKQVMADGRVRHRQIVGISEKLKAGKSPQSGAIRGLKEELGIKVDSLKFVGHLKSEEKFSKSYPGLLCRYTFADFHFEMPDAFFRKEYIAEEEGSTTHFGWK